MCLQSYLNLRTNDRSNLLSVRELYRLQPRSLEDSRPQAVYISSGPKAPLLGLN